MAEPAAGDMRRMMLLVDGDRRDGGLLRTELLRRLGELMLRQVCAKSDAASGGPEGADVPLIDVGRGKNGFSLRFHDD